MKQNFTALLILFLPSFLLKRILPCLGHKIGNNVKIGFSVIKLEKLQLGNDIIIGSFNIFKGPFTLVMDNKARIAHQNYITRAPKGVTYGDAVFKIGYNSNITSKHFIDVTRSVTLGSNTVMGGRDSQIWTHGYVHKETGNERYRVDGEVTIGNNVYMGSRCFINPGVTIADAISIGGGSSVAKNLTKKGMYVNQELRFIEQDFEAIKTRLSKVKDENLVEDVYYKNK